MSADAIFWLTLAAIGWVGWPLHSIAHDIRALRKLVRKNHD